ncbi:hypothetical protein IMAU60066_01421 [Lactobacillus helveticus]|nr:hypothetical protein [Lactobacillus helveticus]
MNLTSLLALIVSSTLVYSAPLILASLGGVYSENSCVVNIGLEDIMTVGAFTSIIFNLTFAQDFGAATPWLGALVGAIFGLIFLLHAFATINLHADHIISGTVLNLLAPPLGVFLIKAIYEKGQTPNITANFGYTNIPGLADIPVIGKSFLLILPLLHGLQLPSQFCFGGSFTKPELVFASVQPVKIRKLLILLA